jgi:3-oxoacyl-[acyl-carrier-protein] synthase-3
MKRRKIEADDIDYFLPHISSEYFRHRIDSDITRKGFHIPQEKWFTNLVSLGNVGAASIYFMLEEIFHSGLLKKGQKLLLGVPESARFSYVYGLVTVV